MSKSNIKIQQFRANDLIDSGGKQFELGKSWCNDFLNIPPEVSKPVIKLIFKPLSARYEQLANEEIELKLDELTNRGDRKAYSNSETGRSQIKDLFIDKLHLKWPDNGSDYFAFMETNSGNYNLYYIPELLYKNFIAFFKSQDVNVSCERREVVSHFLGEKKSLQQIFYGAPGTGKSHTINHTTAGEDVIRTTFHPDTDYSTFVGAYKPTTIEETVMTVIGTKAVPVENADGTTRKESKIVYEFVAQAFLQAYVEAWKKVAEAEGEPKKQFLVIEEINRGNCAQIFGDLFQLLDRNDSGFSDYPIQADADMKRQLQKAFSGMELTNKEALNSLYEGRNVAEEVINGDILLLPSNLYIWGTMNTSDQSLFPIDSAFKRRWDWTYMPISNAYKEWTIKVGNDNYDWWSFLESINDKIGSTTNSEDKKLGYFFCKAQNDVIPVEKFVGKVIFYLWNDVFKDYEFCDAIFNDEDGSKLTFAKFYTEEGRNARIVTDKVAVFLKNLGLEPSFIEPDAETNSVPNSESGSQMDYSKYSLNGEGSYSKGGLVYEAVKRYATAHAESTADEIVNTWLRLGINVPYLVETAQEHEQRKQQTSDSRFDQKSKMLELPNHEVIYISNQFNVQRIEDFIEKVNAQPWHLTLAKI